MVLLTTSLKTKFQSRLFGYLEMESNEEKSKKHRELHWETSYLRQQFPSGSQQIVTRLP